MCKYPTRGDTLRAADPPNGLMRTFSARYGMSTTFCANGPGSDASTVNSGAGSLSMGTTVLCASEFIPFSPTCRSPVQLSEAVEGARVVRAPPHASFHVRNVLNEARTSSVKIFGCSHAAKWQPLGVRP